MYVCWCVSERVCASILVPVSVCVCVCVHVCVCACAFMFVGVCERECALQFWSLWVCVCERMCVSVCACKCVGVCDLPGFLLFLRYHVPQKGWQKRISEKANSPKIPKILQEQEAGTTMELRMCV